MKRRLSSAVQPLVRDDNIMSVRYSITQVFDIEGCKGAQSKSIFFSRLLSDHDQKAERN